MSYGAKMERLELTVMSLATALSVVVAYLPSHRREKVLMAIRESHELLADTFPEDAYAESKESLRSTATKIDRAVAMLVAGIEN